MAPGTSRETRDLSSVFLPSSRLQRCSPNLHQNRARSRMQAAILLEDAWQRFGAHTHKSVMASPFATRLARASIDAIGAKKTLEPEAEGSTAGRSAGV